MLDVLVGLAAALLIGLGLAVIAGPALPRRLGRAVGGLRRLADSAAAASADSEGVQIPLSNPSGQRALLAATRLAGFLAQAGRQDVASQVVLQARRLASDEREGLSGLWTLCRQLEAFPLRGGADHRLEGLVRDLSRAVADRAEQIELLLTR